MFVHVLLKLVEEFYYKVLLEIVSALRHTLFVAKFKCVYRFFFAFILY